MIKLKKIKNTIPDFDAADENTYYNAMNTAPHTPNDTTAPDAENTMSARQLLDGQGYHVAKDDIIQKYFDCKADVEQCMAYLHGLYQLTDCPRYTGDKAPAYNFYIWTTMLCREQCNSWYTSKGCTSM